MKIPKKSLAAAAIAFSVMLATTSCSTEAPSDSTNGDPQNLSIGIVGTTGVTFDTSQAYMYTGYQNWEAVFDTLLRPDPTGKLQPSLATEWSYNDDNTVLTLKLRDGVTFTDDVTFDSAAVKENLEFFKNGGGGEASRLSLLESVETPDAQTVVITLSEPDPEFLISLSQSAGFMSSPDALGAETPVGSGPYVLDTAETVTGSEYVYSRNEDYWGEELPYDTVSIRNFDSPTSLLNAMQSGQVNYALLDAPTGDAAQKAGFDNAGAEIEVVTISIYDRDGEMVPALADPRVRQAMNYAIDRDLILENFGYGMGNATAQVWSPSSEGFSSELDTALGYDPDKARKLLAEAGYSDGFEFTMPRSPAYDQSLMTTIQEMFGEVGIKVNYQDVDRTQLFGMVRDGTWPVFYLDRWVMFPDWQTVTSYVGNDSIWNLFAVQDEKIGELTETLRTTTDDAEFAKTAQELNEYVVDQGFYVALYRKEQQNIHDDKTTVVPQPYYSIPSLYNFAPAGQ